MKPLSLLICLAACLIVGFMTGATEAAELTLNERLAIFQAAGFKKIAGDQYARCEEQMASSTPGRIEMEDLNGDGRPEAWVKESNLFCYGNTAEYFVLLTQGSGGWRLILEGVGIPVALSAKRQGWPDIEVGGPGFGKFPIYRWTGQTYAPTR